MKKFVSAILMFIASASIANAYDQHITYFGGKSGRSLGGKGGKKDEGGFCYVDPTEMMSIPCMDCGEYGGYEFLCAEVYDPDPYYEDYDECLALLESGEYELKKGESLVVEATIDSVEWIYHGVDIRRLQPDLPLAYYNHTGGIFLDAILYSGPPPSLTAIYPVPTRPWRIRQFVEADDNYSPYEHEEARGGASTVKFIFHNTEADGMFNLDFMFYLFVGTEAGVNEDAPIYADSEIGLGQMVVTTTKMNLAETDCDFKDYRRTRRTHSARARAARP